MEDYPKTFAELEKRFATEAACREYLASLRWQDGFACPRCGFGKGWRMSKSLMLCGSCRHQASVTQGTIFQGSHLAMATWFRIMWHVCAQKNGMSALGLQRAMGLGSYRTAWMALHKLRKAMVRPGRERLAGTVEVDETFVGGERPGKRGRGAAGKTLVLIAAEQDGQGPGRIRLAQIKDASAKSIEMALATMVNPGATITTDGWGGYAGLEGSNYGHEIVRTNASVGEDLLPRCHLVASLLKRWIMGTLHGSLSVKHLPDYLNEFTFRFNRRTSGSRGKLFYRLVQMSVQYGPSSYAKLAGTPSVGGG
jgi:transposase-like protein